MVISERLVALARCPRCLLERQEAHRLQPQGASFCCPECGTVYAVGEGYLDLRIPDGISGKETLYVAEAEAFAEALDYRVVGEPLLGAAIRERWLRRWIPAGPGAQILDIGAGDGRFALWTQARGAQVIGLDAAALFADATVRTVDLVQGDARLLPFAASVFDAAYSIDVMEHLDAPGLERFFAEVSRVLKPGGRFYLYSNTRERSTLWPIIALWGRISRALRQRQIGEFARDDRRKADHVKVLRTWPQVAAFAAYHQLEVAEVRFWNGLFQGLIDNVLVRIGERFLLAVPSIARHSSGARQPGPAAGGLSPRQSVSRRPVVRLGLRGLTWLMQLDVILFGRLRSGPFFALLRKSAPARPAAALSRDRDGS